MALLIKQPFMALVDHVRCLEILTDPARTVTTDYGRFAYGCSQARKASARARAVTTRAPYGTRRVDIRILTIPKNTDNPQNACMHVAMHIEEGWFHTDFPRVIGPYCSPSPTARDLSYALRDVEITCIRAFYGLSVYSLVTGLRDTVCVPYRFHKVHMWAP